MTADLLMDLRNVYWVPRNECGRAQDAINAFFNAATVMPAVKEALREVLLELDVTRVREDVWPEGVANARLAKNISSELLPILMSDSELSALRMIPGLPASLHQALNEGGPREPPSAASPPRGSPWP